MGFEFSSPLFLHFAAVAYNEWEGVSNEFSTARFFCAVVLLDVTSSQNTQYYWALYERESRSYSAWSYSTLYEPKTLIRGPPIRRCAVPEVRGKEEEVGSTCPSENEKSVHRHYTGVVTSPGKPNTKKHHCIYQIGEKA